jgi:hypothetical protein
MRIFYILFNWKKRVPLLLKYGRGLPSDNSTAASFPSLQHNYTIRWLSGNRRGIQYQYHIQSLGGGRCGCGCGWRGGGGGVGGGVVVVVAVGAGSGAGAIVAVAIAVVAVAGGGGGGGEAAKSIESCIKFVHPDYPISFLNNVRRKETHKVPRVCTTFLPRADDPWTFLVTLKSRFCLSS